jgi:hypothetical protein
MMLHNPTVQSVCLQNLTEPDDRNQCHNQNKETTLLETSLQKLRQTLLASDTRYEVMQ